MLGFSVALDVQSAVWPPLSLCVEIAIGAVRLNDSHKAVESRLVLPLLCLALLSGCASGPECELAEGVNMEWVSRPRKGPVTHLVLHHTATSNTAALRILSGRDPSTRVSVHYLITDEPEPRIIEIVPEDKVAFHAGVSQWAGARDLNETSIGIEIVNLDGNVHPYGEAQFAVIASLAADIVRRHGIRPENVVAHSDIAPGRKLDPGVLFPWRRLEREAGVGCWADPSDVAVRLRNSPPLPLTEVQAALTRWGYDVPATGKHDDATRGALAAFQRHHRPSRVDGYADRETVAILLTLIDAHRR